MPAKCATHHVLLLLVNVRAHSITISSATNFVAFMLTSAGKLPALSWFGIYAGMSMLFIYFAHLTVFAALLTLDEQRVEARRADCSLCCSVGAAESPKGAGESDSDKDKDKDKKASASDSGMTVFIRNYYAPFLLKPAVKAFVVVIFVALTSVLTWQATSHLTTEFDLRLLAPDDRYVYHSCQPRTHRVTVIAERHANQTANPPFPQFSARLVRRLRALLRLRLQLRARRAVL